MQFLHTRRFTSVILTIVAVLGLVVLFSPGASPSASAHSLQPQKPHSGAGAVAYTHVATAANTTAYWTELDNKVTNNNPQAFLIVMPNLSASSTGHIADNHPVAVWYDAMMGKWAIINQDKAAMPVGAAFNVFAIGQAQQIVNSQNGSVVPHSGYSQSMDITEVASASNTKGNWMYIDSPTTNGDPSAFVNATVNWSVSGVYDPHPLGTFYDTTAQKWAIFNEGSIDPVPQGAAFNLEVNASSVYGVILHTSTANNTSGNRTFIDELSQLNNSSQAIVFAMPNFNPQGQGGAYETHNLGLFYQHGKWAIFNEDNAAMTTHLSFNVLVASFTPAL